MDEAFVGGGEQGVRVMVWDRGGVRRQLQEVRSLPVDSGGHRQLAAMAAAVRLW